MSIAISKFFNIIFNNFFKFLMIFASRCLIFSKKVGL